MSEFPVILYTVHCTFNPFIFIISLSNLFITYRFDNPRKTFFFYYYYYKLKSASSRIRDGVVDFIRFSFFAGERRKETNAHKVMIVKRKKKETSVRGGRKLCSPRASISRSVRLVLSSPPLPLPFPSFRRYLYLLYSLCTLCV